jgi:hypothetical protein
MAHSTAGKFSTKPIEYRSDELGRELGQMLTSSCDESIDQSHLLFNPSHYVLHITLLGHIAFVPSCIYLGLHTAAEFTKLVIICQQNVPSSDTSGSAAA